MKTIAYLLLHVTCYIIMMHRMLADKYNYTIDHGTDFRVWFVHDVSWLWRVA